MRKLLILLVGTCCIFNTSKAQTEVITGVTRGKDFGVVYFLPKTEIKVEVKVTKVTFTPGEFSRYADRYLRLSNVSGEADEHWELNSITATAVGVPDKEHAYFVKLKDKTVAPLIELTADGIVKSINIPFVATPSVKQAASTPVENKVTDTRDFLTEEILMANSTAKMAELTAKEIYNIRESRNALVRGQADNMPKDGEQLKLMLTVLEEQENAMLELFTGTKSQEEKVYTFSLIPNMEGNDEVLFRFSRKLGILEANDLAGEPVYLNLNNLSSVPLPAEDSKKKDVTGIAYNVPGKASLQIAHGKNKVYEGEFSVTQFGIIEYLAPTLFNKNSTIKVMFNPVTGALIKVDRE